MECLVAVQCRSKRATKLRVHFQHGIFRAGCGERGKERVENEKVQMTSLGDVGAAARSGQQRQHSAARPADMRALSRACH